MLTNTKPRIAITMGDPAGVGPELVLRALVDDVVRQRCQLTVFGDALLLERCAHQLGIPAPTVTRISLDEYAADDCAGAIEDDTARHVVVDLENVDFSVFQPCVIQSGCGKASYEYIQAAIDAALLGKVEAVTTAPINKEALRLAAINYPGHTEMFAERAQADRWCMMQYSKEITCTFVTVHCGYSDVPKLLTTQRVRDTIALTDEALTRIRGKRPHIVVCGLNPHAGENGLFGNMEEENIIAPAIAAARADGVSLEGPLPPDTAFLPWKRDATDAYVCMYHDQGHIPVKALAFDSAVNTTLGLKIIRTSVDHGTAFDIAWQGKARPSSLYSAIHLAAQLSGTNAPLRSA